MLVCVECGREGTLQYHMTEDGAVCSRRNPCLQRQGIGKSRYDSLTPEARERHKARARQYVLDNPEKHSEYRRRSYWREKLAAIAILGGACVNCGTDNPLVLSVNHRHEGSSAANGSTGKELYREIAASAEFFSEQFDLRCLNCQLLYEYETGRNSLPESDEFSDLQRRLHADRPIR